MSSCLTPGPGPWGQGNPSAGGRGQGTLIHATWAELAGPTPHSTSSLRENLAHWSGGCGKTAQHGGPKWHMLAHARLACS